MGYTFRNPGLLTKAMTHSSLAPAGLRSYERLEFLGDAVVGLVVAEELFSLPESYSEGEMTEMKSATVSRRSLVRAGKRLDLQHYLRVDRGLAQRKSYPPSLTANAYEALVGAVFLDGGFEEARKFILRSLEPELMAARQSQSPPNCKSILQERLQAEGKPHPAYHTARKVGLEHDMWFQAAVSVEGRQVGAAWGRTKKQAEQAAARLALDALYPGWQPGGDFVDAMEEPPPG